MKIRSYLAPALVSLFVLIQSTTLSDELEVVESSSEIRLGSLPAAAFFDSTLSIRVRLNGNNEAVEDGATVIGVLFQKAGKRLVPLTEAAEVGIFKRDKSGALVADIEIQIPELEKPVDMKLRIQVAEKKVGRTIEFRAIPDDLLASLAERGVRTTTTDSVKSAFKDRELKVYEKKPGELAKKWRGIWFIQLEGDDRANLKIPNHLEADQVVVILEAPSSQYLFPIALNKGDGWVVQMPADWFKTFSTNAGAQLAFVKTIDKLTTQ